MDKKTAKISCIASATRHSAPVGSVAISPTTSKLVATVSQDLCLKLWNLPNSTEYNGTHNIYYYYCLLSLIFTVILHVHGFRYI